MEHIVGIKVNDKNLGEVGFLTWGRIFHPVDSELLLDTVQKHFSKFGIYYAETVVLCDTLQEISHFPYFYEGLFEFSQKIIPEGKKYRIWQESIMKALEKGEEIYFLGVLPEKKEKLKVPSGSISHGFAWSD
jgi:hypothetical protein